MQLFVAYAVVPTFTPYARPLEREIMARESFPETDVEKTLLAHSALSSNKSCKLKARRRLMKPTAANVEFLLSCSLVVAVSTHTESA